MATSTSFYCGFESRRSHEREPMITADQLVAHAIGD